MPLIKFFEHPFQNAGAEIIEHHSLPEWLLEKFGPVPTVTIQIFKGEPSSNSEITHDIDQIVYGHADYYTVLQSPGAAIAAIGLTNLILAASAITVAAAYLLTPKAGAVPQAGNTTTSSPNNELSERRNKVRVLQRIEDIYGTVRSIPSLLMPSYSKYINNVQYEYSYLCVGRGYYSISDLRDGETLLSDIDGARAAIYDPFTSPNSGDDPVAEIGDSIEDTILTVKRSNEVDGITLKALNQIQIKDTDTYDFIPASLFGATGDVIRQTTKQPNMASVVQPGDVLVVDTGTFSVVFADDSVSVASGDQSYNGTGFNVLGLSPGMTVTVAGFTTGANNGSKTIVSATNTKIVVSGSSLVTEASGDDIAITRSGISYSGNYEVDTVEDGHVVLTSSTFTAQKDDQSASVQIDGISEWTSWITLPESDRTQIFINLIALNGIYKDGGGGKIDNSVSVEFEIERLDSELIPTGTVETVTETLSGATSETRAATLETITGFTGPCRVRARRTSDYDYAYGGVVVDEIKFADLYAVSPVSKTEFGNVTTIHTVTKATIVALATKQRQLNCLASRLLPTWSGTQFSGAFDSDGRLASGTISATSRFIDIVAAIAVDPAIGARDLSTDVDMRQLWATYQAVEGWYSDFAQFNHTFDSDNTSFEDTIRQIADACFCTAYRQNGKIRFAFHRAQTSPNLPTFTHRNKRPDSETITRTFANDGEYDGVEFVYQDPDTERAETIRLPTDASYTKLKKIEIPGIRSYATAWVRANREYQKLRNRRLVLEFEATADARLLLPGAKIDVVDDTRFRRYGGEVVAQNGLELTLSQPVEFIRNQNHSIILMRRDGTTQSISCRAGSSVNKVILSGLPAESIVSQYSEGGIRTIYSFAADSVRDSQSWLVQEITARDQDYIQIRAINYTPDYYTYDYGELPDKDTIIY